MHFQGFTVAQQSHRKLDNGAHLLENKIGGVIMGSVVAVQQGIPLNCLQYQNDKRSNIPNKTGECHVMRDLVFDEFEPWKEWKSTERNMMFMMLSFATETETTADLFFR